MIKKIDHFSIITNFVATVDGKIQVLQNSDKYWPIGSKTDFEHMLDARAKSDLLIHGKGTALFFRHIDRIASSPFKEKRKKAKKSPLLPYMVISSSASDDLIPYLENFPEQPAFLVTTEEGKVSEKLSKWVRVLRFGKGQVDLKKLVEYLKTQGYKRVLMEGGPTLLGSFLKEDLIDEINLTIAPKIFGNLPGKTLSMVEGVLFPAEKVKNLELKAVKKIKDELYLKYKVLH